MGVGFSGEKRAPTSSNKFLKILHDYLLILFSNLDYKNLITFTVPHWLISRYCISAYTFNITYVKNGNNSGGKFMRALRGTLDLLGK